MIWRNRWWLKVAQQKIASSTCHPTGENDPQNRWCPGSRRSPINYHFLKFAASTAVLEQSNNFIPIQPNVTTFKTQAIVQEECKTQKLDTVWAKSYQECYQKMPQRTCHVLQTLDISEPVSFEAGGSCQHYHTWTEQQFHLEIYKSTKCNNIQITSYCQILCALRQTQSKKSVTRKCHK